MRSHIARSCTRILCARADKEGAVALRDRVAVKAGGGVIEEGSKRALLHTRWAWSCRVATDRKNHELYVRIERRIKIDRATGICIYVSIHLCIYTYAM